MDIRKIRKICDTLIAHVFLVYLGKSRSILILVMEAKGKSWNTVKKRLKQRKYSQKLKVKLTLIVHQVNQKRIIIVVKV